MQSSYMFETETVSNFMGALAIVAGVFIMALEYYESRHRDRGGQSGNGLRLFRFRVNRWLVGLAGIATGLWLLVIGPL